MTLVPALLWMLAIEARQTLIRPRCLENPEACSRSSVLAIDRIALGHETDGADQLSYYTQNTSGILAFTVPAAWHGFLLASGALAPGAALLAMGTDLVLVAQTSVWNGLLNECARLLVQRPRPFVFANPGGEGGNPSNYTSFYSGHTSFTAASSVALVLILLSRAAPLILILAAGFASPLLVLSTGALRVLAGRHFVTDVIVGGIAGTIVAFWVALSHKK